eukprot:11056459-Heterocapsa_arctica.AAC.1
MEDSAPRKRWYGKLLPGVNYPGSKALSLLLHILTVANGGILAGCGFAVHYLQATIQVDVKEEGKELRYFADDM